MEEVYLTNSSDQTQEVAEKSVKGIKTRILALYGELGSGKTTFIQGLARGLGVAKRIISPTFVIIRHYKVGIRNPVRGEARQRRQELGIRNFYHIDLYRIEDNKEIEGLGLEEIINDPQNLVAIEWAEKMKNSLPKDRIDIYFEYIDEQKRRVTIKKGN